MAGKIEMVKLGEMRRAYGNVSAPPGVSEHDLHVFVWQHLGKYYPGGKTCFGRLRSGDITPFVFMSWSHEWKEV